MARNRSPEGMTLWRWAATCGAYSPKEVKGARSGSSLCEEASSTKSGTASSIYSASSRLDGVVDRIAKKTEIEIKQTRRNERGKVETTWEVRNPPGPLSYKLDTIIINRRIDEMRNRGEIQQLIKLGSLRDLCEELGINPSGKNTNALKEALRENAFAGITAKIKFA